MFAVDDRQLDRFRGDRLARTGESVGRRKRARFLSVAFAGLGLEISSANGRLSISRRKHGELPSF